MTAATPNREFKSVTHALYQARMWREYAMTFHGRRTRSGVDQQWVETVGGNTYRECLDRAWEAARAASRIQG